MKIRRHFCVAGLCGGAIPNFIGSIMGMRGFMLLFTTISPSMALTTAIRKLTQSMSGGRQRRRFSTALSSTADPSFIPRAAVAVVVRWCPSSTSSTPRWILVQRGNQPNKGMWSIPGGKIETGEATLDAAKRELREEVRMEIIQQNTKKEAADAFDLKWYSDGPFACSDSIHSDASGKGFHYVISQCFAEVIATSKPSITASDDAMDARWWSADEVRKAEDDGVVTRGVLRVLERSELRKPAISGAFWCDALS